MALASSAGRLGRCPASLLNSCAYYLGTAAYCEGILATGLRAYSSASTSREQSTDINAAFASSRPEPGKELATLESKKEDSGYVPAWLRNLIPGAKHFLPSGSRSRGGSGPDGQSDKALSQDKQSDKEYKQMMAELEESKDMDMDGYVGYCRKIRIQTSPPPRPRVAPVPRWHHDYGMFIDLRRASYLRICQHEKIGSIMTDEEKELILEQEEDAMQNKKLLAEIADRSGIYMDLEVKDCIGSFLEARKSSLRQYRWVKELGNEMPRSEEQRKVMTSHMEKLESEEKLAMKLARQDIENCPMRPLLSWVGPTSVCSRTGLKYFECCGSKELPAHLVSKEKSAFLKDSRGRLSPRSEYKLRKSMKKQMDPKFQ